MQPNFDLHCSQKINESRSASQSVISLPIDKNSDLCELKAFPGVKMNVAENLKFVYEKGRKHCGKRSICWLPTVSPFPTMFSKDVPMSPRVRVRIVCKGCKDGKVSTKSAEKHEI